MSLFYSKDCSLDLVGYSDVGYLSDPYKARSQISYMFICGDTVISWRYTKQSIIATSSNYAEIIAIHEASRECVWLRIVVASSLQVLKHCLSLTMSLTAYHNSDGLSKALPNNDKFINKKIKIFDEISLVCGNDWARGDCAKSFEDIDFDSFFEKDNDNDLKGPSLEKDVRVTKASQIKASRKRKRSFEVQDVVGDISIKFGEVTTAIGRMVDSHLDVKKLYEEVMAMEGYNEEFLGDAFDYLVQSDTLA
ncbi:hypothetical protein FXO37_26816 [Capsicum annuum]|nr:hypothetical protein FXO37_26816 [Capsicum annuum]